MATATDDPPVGTADGDDERHLRSVTDMTAEGEGEEPEDDGTSQLVLPGTGTKLSGNVGGKKPTESYFKMSSVALSVAGDMQIEKDTELWIAIPVAIDEVQVRNRRKDGEIVSVKRVHTASAVGQPVILERSPLDD
jgi:hypothetical protein